MASAAPVSEIRAALVGLDLAITAIEEPVELSAALEVPEFKLQRRVELGRLLDDRLGWAPCRIEVKENRHRILGVAGDWPFDFDSTRGPLRPPVFDAPFVPPGIEAVLRPPEPIVIGPPLVLPVPSFGDFVEPSELLGIGEEAVEVERTFSGRKFQKLLHHLFRASDGQIILAPVRHKLSLLASFRAGASFGSGRRGSVPSANWREMEVEARQVLEHQAPTDSVSLPAHNHERV